MAGILYPHNEEAYQSAAAMLAAYGKAAVIHPTGTGKSLIGFQLCLDHPSARVCWLSPSEHIFRTQLENWQAAGGGELPNISFFTYARLMMLSQEELSVLHPDYIVLDEFHRCGAEQWGRGVRRLEELYPQAGLLGLSATNVRYLDNRRDMAKELFGGRIASEMTLGEAIARGILHPPRYVLGMFSLESEWRKYEARIRRAGSGPAGDRARKLLDALRRTLEQADGLDVMFEKHMRERTGKYIIFCANAKHMDEMISHVPEWFGRIDPEPRVYRTYSEDPAAGRAFAGFKADTSRHLKLLFCIDMLNEGIHVEEVSGVVLFRPTVSPIIYKQQVGRALSASQAREAVIFDVVNNIENLYSIGAVEAEIREAAEALRFCGEGERIVHESFRVIDELRDCRSLFEALEDTLSASWDLMYGYAAQYFREARQPAGSPALQDTGGVRAGQLAHDAEEGAGRAAVRKPVRRADRQAGRHRHGLGGPAYRVLEPLLRRPLPLQAAAGGFGCSGRLCNGGGTPPGGVCLQSAHGAVRRQPKRLPDAGADTTAGCSGDDLE